MARESRSPQVAAPSERRKVSQLREAESAASQRGAAASVRAARRSVAPSSASPSAKATRAATFSGTLSTNFSCHQEDSTLKKRTAKERRASRFESRMLRRSFSQSPKRSGFELSEVSTR